MTADQAIAPVGDPEEQSELEDAKGFLRGLLADGPVPAKQVASSARDGGHTMPTIRRAKQALGIEVVKEGGHFGKAKQQWVWGLPDSLQVITNPEGNHTNKVITFSILQTPSPTWWKVHYDRRGHPERRPICRCDPVGRRRPLRYRGPGESLAKHLPAIKAHKSEILAVLQEAREAEDLLEFFEERAAILEFDAGLPTTDAELEAARMTATLARNRGYQWASLRAALDGYPALSHAGARHARHGGYPAPCVGTATVAVLSGRRVVRQGTFSGAHEVKT